VPWPSELGWRVSPSFFSPLIPANAGTQSLRKALPRIIAVSYPHIYRPKHWVPAFAGMSGKEGR